MASCTSYAYLTGGNPLTDRLTTPVRTETVTCERPLHHKGKHKATLQLWTVAERPRGGKPLSKRDATVEWA